MDGTGIYINGHFTAWKDLKTVRHIQYRGVLNDCNYSCAYCPFSKRFHLQKIEDRDRECLERLLDRLKEEKKSFTFQIVPYGEALIHPYYWEFLAKLSRLPQAMAVGGQTNASFPIRKMLAIYQEHGGNINKLRLWCTFHPTMVSVGNFICQIKKLTEYGIALCTGAVADPSQKEAIFRLYSMLPQDIYFWLNQMDGRKKAYTPEDRTFFEEIDPFFFMEEAHISTANCGCCTTENIFIEASGDYFSCNINRIRLGNLYENDTSLQKKCSRKECSCFLAYQNRMDVLPELILFFPYPAFRIVKRYQAAFFDIDHTLVMAEETSISEKTANILAVMSRYCDIYLATSLPYAAAMKTCGRIRSLLSGGIFAGGAHIHLSGRKKKQNKNSRTGKIAESTQNTDKQKNQYLLIDASLSRKISDHYSQCGFSVRIYRKKLQKCPDILTNTPDLTGVYKITLIPKNKQWHVSEKDLTFHDDHIHSYIEHDHIQIVNAAASKQYGVSRICQMMGYSPKAILTCGDSEEDREMAEPNHDQSRYDNIL